MIVYIWRVKIDTDYTKGMSDCPEYDVAAKRFNQALQKAQALVPKTMTDNENGAVCRLKRSEVVLVERGRILDA